MRIFAAFTEKLGVEFFQQSMVSVKITVFLYILVFFELGAVLIISPWNSFWSNNLLLAYLVQHIGAPDLATVVNSGLIRWAVTGLGIINIFLGIWEAFNYKRLVHLLLYDHAQPAEEAVAVSHNQPKGV